MGINGEFYPWRRFFARTLDLSIYNALWSIFLIFVFHVNLAAISNMERIFNSFMAIFIMLLLEPLWLNLSGTTPGKAVFGIKIEKPEGEKLSYLDGFQRTWKVIGAGMGYNIPIYNLVRMWKSYKKCIQNESQPWDEGLSYTIKDTKVYRSVIFVAAHAIVFAVLATAMSAQLLPPNRGDLTVAEFVENYNYYAKYYGIDFGNKYLNKDGKWAEKKFDGTAYLNIGLLDTPDYNFITENGYVTGLFFEVQSENNRGWIHPYDVHMFLTSMSLAGAQKDMGLFSKIPKQILVQINNNLFRDFNYTVAGIEIENKVNLKGYLDGSWEILIPSENEGENYFNLRFSVNKVK